MGLARDNLNTRVHFIELINADQWLFGGIVPALWLQERFFTGYVGYHDILATIFYFLHFALPLAFGYLLWVDNKSRSVSSTKVRFRQFVIAILLLSYAGWISYLIYPAAPPWLASQAGYLPEVHKIIETTFTIFPEKLHLPTIYHNFNPNPVAAMPSMHAAYPLLVLLFAFKFWRVKALFFLPYVLFVWTSMVYLGEHYVIDIIVGAIYAVTFFYIAKLLYSQPWLKRVIEH